MKLNDHPYMEGLEQFIAQNKNIKPTDHETIVTLHSFAMFLIAYMDIINDGPIFRREVKKGFFKGSDRVDGNHGESAP